MAQQSTAHHTSSGADPAPSGEGVRDTWNPHKPPAEAAEEGHPLEDDCVHWGEEVLILP